MLSYRHAFHAGNHADVLKHWLFSLVLDYYNQKDKPYWVIDTHAGAGAYSLAQPMANKTAEYRDGIARMQAQATEATPQACAAYLQAVTTFQQQHGAQTYPGSPCIAAQFLRLNDKLRLFELHPADSQLLIQHFSDRKRQVSIQASNGFDGLKACLPPPSKRAVVLIDPPYEVKEDYRQVVSSLQDSLKRFATGTYLLWYPRLQRPEPAMMLDKLKQLDCDYLHVWLDVQTPSPQGFGMHGSGMFILNPPWTLPDTVRPVLDWLTNTLAQDAHARSGLEVQMR